MNVKSLKQQRMKFTIKNLNGNQRGVKAEALEKLYVDKSSEKRMLKKFKQKM